MNLARLSPARIGLTTRRNTIHRSAEGKGNKILHQKFFVRESIQSPRLKFVFALTSKKCAKLT